MRSLNIKGVIAKSSAILFTFALSIAMTQSKMVFANPTSAPAGEDFSWIKGKGNDTFSSLTKTVKETGASGYQLMMAVGFVGMIICLMITGISFYTHKNAQKKQENKSHLVSIFGGGIIFFGAFFIIGLIQSIAAGLG